MWGAIIQAIDHAMGRMHEGAGAGIKVANSQHGGGAPISNMDAKQTGEAARSLMQQNQDTTSEQDEAAEKAKIGSNSTSTGTDAGGQAEGGAGALGSIGSIGAGSEGASTEGAAEAASSILSDETAKTAQNASSDSEDDAKAAKAGKFAAVRQYGAGVGTGFANAGAIATGNKAAEWENIDNGVAKKAAENTVKNWRKRDFNKQENASAAEVK